MQHSVSRRRTWSPHAKPACRREIVTGVELIPPFLVPRRFTSSVFVS